MNVNGLGLQQVQQPPHHLYQQALKDLPSPSQNSIEKMFRNVGDLSRQALLHQSSQREQLVQPVFSAVTTEEEETRLREQSSVYRPKLARSSEFEILEPRAAQLMQKADERLLGLRMQHSHIESESQQNVLSDKYGATATFSPHRLLNNNTFGTGGELNLGPVLSKPDPANFYYARSPSALGPTNQYLKQAPLGLANSASHEQLA